MDSKRRKRGRAPLQRTLADNANLLHPAIAVSWTECYGPVDTYICIYLYLYVCVCLYVFICLCTYVYVFSLPCIGKIKWIYKMNTRSTLGSLRSRRRIAYARAAKRYRYVPFLPQYALLRPPMYILFNASNFCGGAAAGFVGGPVFPFSDFLPICWQEFDSKFILYRWKEGFFVGIYKKKGLGLCGHNRKTKF